MTGETKHLQQVLQLYRDLARASEQMDLARASEQMNALRAAAKRLRSVPPIIEEDFL